MAAPSISSWIGIEAETSHTGHLIGCGAPLLANYLIGEYEGPRCAFAAQGVQELDEARAADTAWQLVASAGQQGEQRVGTARA